ncbi:MAG TPA: polysaccharide deacetylase family protein [Thermoanaerobaculia bacterium]|nr:polysaccharide deacetylase family protein [Thermoanaerobaculia bacterium]
MRGHLYCSPRCAREDGRLALWRPVQKRLARPVPPRLALAAVALAVIAPMLLALKTVGELDRLSTAAFSPVPVRRPPAARIETVTEGPEGARIEGVASPGGAVFLFGSAGFVASTPVADGRFRFEKIRQMGPYRVGVLPLSSEVGSTIGSSPPERAAEEPEPVTRGVSGAPARPPAAASHSAAGERPSIPDLTRGPRDRPELVLSFDAGSSDRGARQILDALRARGIQTTVFLTGDFIRRYPDVARRVAKDGHEVGNHTDSHPHLTTYAQDGRQATRPGVDRAFVARELRATAEAWLAATGRPLAPLWRAPYGEQNAEIRYWAAQEGYWHVGWTGGRAGLDGLDWVSDPSSRAYRSAGKVVDRLVSHAESGGIILLHLGSDREDPVAPLVPQLLDALSRRGFRLARASEFLTRLGMTEERLAGLTLAGRTPSP